MNKHIRIALLGLFAAFLLFGSSGCPQKGGDKQPAKPEPALSADKILFYGMDGKKVSLKALAGEQPVYLTFFASWCNICIKEVPTNNKIFEKYGKNGLKVIGVNVGEDSEIVKKFVAAYKVSYPVVGDPEEEVAKSMKMIGLPLNIVLDAKGREIYRDAAPPADDVLKSVTEAK
ncbi:MAG: TlpA disulfide reductase family protein [bacterium]